MKISKTDEKRIDIYFNLSVIKLKSAETSAMTAKVVTWLSPPPDKSNRKSLKVELHFEVLQFESIFT